MNQHQQMLFDALKQKNMELRYLTESGFIFFDYRLIVLYSELTGKVRLRIAEDNEVKRLTYDCLTKTDFNNAINTINNYI